MRRIGVVAIALSMRALSAQDATAAATATAEAPPKDAVVTFYAGGNPLKNHLLWTKNAVFSGCIYDGNEQVGCITWRGFLTVPMPPGVHVFSASLSGRHPAKNSQTPILLEAGKSYFVRAQMEIPKVETVPIPIVDPPLGAALPVPVHHRKGWMDIVSCETAHQETMKARPMPDRNVGKGFKASVLDDMPDCPATPATAKP